MIIGIIFSLTVRLNADTITVTVPSSFGPSTIPNAPSIVGTGVTVPMAASVVVFLTSNGSNIDMIWSYQNGATVAVRATAYPSTDFINNNTSGFKSYSIPITGVLQDLSGYFQLSGGSITFTSNNGPTPTPSQTPTPSGPTPTPSPIPTPGPSNQFPISFQSQSGVLFSSGQEIGTGVIFPYSVQLGAGLPLLQASLEVASTNVEVFQLVRTFYISGSPTIVNIGTVSFSSGTLNNPTISFASLVTFNPGDKLQLYAPASIDATASGLTLTVVGNIL